MSFTIDLSGLETLRTQLDEFAENVHSTVAMRGVAAMAKEVYDAARFYAPISEKAHWFYGRQSVRTGQRYLFQPGSLHDAIYRAYSPEKSGQTSKIYRVSWNHRKAPYGHMVEFGTSRAPAHPFLGRSLSHLPQAIAAGKTAMGMAVSEITTRRT